MKRASCSTRFHYVDRGSGVLWKKYSLISSMKEYNKAVLLSDDGQTDIVTGRHLKKIPKAVPRNVACLSEKTVGRYDLHYLCGCPSWNGYGAGVQKGGRTGRDFRSDLVICMHLREGRKPPMVHVRQSLYSLLEPGKKKGNVVNLLGFFSPLVDDCEIYDLLHSAGVKTIHEISRCKDYMEYQTMSEANFNLVLHHEARSQQKDFHNRLQIPFIELRRLSITDKIENQYHALGNALGAAFYDEKYKKQAEDALEKFRQRCPDASFARSEECLNA